jgi:catechol 2,3-dioxygenase-like lactoylglutathione lyase family enzyme
MSFSNSRVIATIAVNDIENAKFFYCEVLGMKLVVENGEGAVFESGGGTFAIYPSTTAGTNRGTSAWWSVDDVESTVSELKQKGVVFEHIDDLPGWKRQGDIHVKGEKKAAWFKDPDGNTLGLGNY